MKNDYLWMLGFAAILVLVVVLLQWPDKEQQQSPQQNQISNKDNSSAVATEAEVYGITIALLDDTKRSITWLSQEKINNSMLRIKQTDEAWEEATVILAEEEYSSNDGKQIYAYTAEIDHLQESRSYHYVLTAGEEILTEEYTLRIADVKENSFQFIHMTDSQGIVEQDFQQWGTTLQAAVAAAPEAAFIVHGGDLTDDPTSEQQWKWFYQYAPALSMIPFMPTTGNHEQIEDDASGFAIRFHTPDNGAAGSQAHTTYYVKYHNLLLISLNTEGNIKGQLQWLKQVLAEQHQQSEWIVVSMHRGVYGASKFKDGEDWVKVFDKYGVDLVLQGHNHQYSRSFPLLDGERAGQDNKGTIYVTLNASGTKFNEEKKAKDYQAVAFQNGKSMYAIIDVTDELLTYSAYDITGTLLDQFSINSND